MNASCNFDATCVIKFDFAFANMLVRRKNAWLKFHNFNFADVDCHYAPTLTIERATEVISA